MDFKSKKYFPSISLPSAVNFSSQMDSQGNSVFYSFSREAECLHASPSLYFLDFPDPTDNFKCLVDTAYAYYKQLHRAERTEAVLSSCRQLMRLRSLYPTLIEAYVASDGLHCYLYCVNSLQVFISHDASLSQFKLDTEAVSGAPFPYQSQIGVEISLPQSVDLQLSDLNINFPGVESFMQTMQTTLSSNFSDVNIISNLMVMFSNLVVAWRNRSDPITVGCCIINTLLSCRVSYDLALRASAFLGKSFTSVMGYFSPMKSESLGSLSSVKEIFMPIITIIATFLSVLISSKLPDQKSIDFALRRMSDFGRAIFGMEKSYSFLSTWISKAFDVCFEKFGGIPRGALDCDAYLSEVTSYFTEIQQVLERDNFDNICQDIHLCDRVTNLYRRGLLYSEHLSKMNLNRVQMDPFYVHFRELSKLYQRVTQDGARNFAPRTEPVVIQLFGDSGVGKSGLVFLLAQDLLAEENLQDKVIENIYMRQVEQEYWDGYHGQLICVYDDFGQRVDTSNTPNEEFMEIIRTGNIIPMMCHMASLQEKSRTPFVSKALILTSNENHYDIKSLTKTNAFYRRRHLLAKVHVNPKYGKVSSAGVTRIDPSLLRKFDLPALSDDVYLFQLHDSETGKGQVVSRNGALEPVLIDYKTFARMCRDEYARQFTMSQNRLVALRDRAAVLQSQVDDEFDDDDILPIQYVCLAIWLDENANLKDVKSDSSHLTDELRDSLRALARQHGDYDSYYNACVDLFSNTPLVLPARSSSFSTKLRLIAFDLYLFGKSWAIIIQTHSLSFAQTTVTSLLAHLRRASSTFSKVFKRNMREFSSSPLATKLFTVNQLILGCCFALTLWHMLKPTPKVSPKPVKKDKSCSHKTEALFGECQMRKMLKCEFEDIDLDTAYQIHGSFCFLNCVFCSSLRERVSHIRVDFGSSVNVIDTATEIYEIASFEDASESNGSGDSRTLASRNFKTEKQSGDSLSRTAKQFHTERQSSDSLSKQAKHFSTENTRKRNFFSPDDTLNSELAFDVNQQELIQSKVFRNLYRIYVWQNNAWKAIVNGLFVRGRCLLIPFHAVEFIKQSPRILLRNNYIDQGYEVPSSGIDFYPVTNSRGDEKDACLATIPAGFVPCKVDITKHFVRAVDLSSIRSCRSTIASLRDQSNILVPMQFTSIDVKALDRQVYEHREPDGSTRLLHLRQGYEYRADTARGDCGSPLVASNKSIARKILGIHVCGKEGTGVSNSLSQEDLDRTFHSIPMRSQIALDVSKEIFETSDVVLPGGDFEPLGKLSRSLRTPSKTSLRQSPLYGHLDPPTMAPSVLRPVKINDVVVDPLEQGLRKCGKKCVLIDDNLIDAACTEYQQILNSKTKDSQRRVLTYEESIQGVSEDPFIEPINRRSSPGWPWVESRKGTIGKTKWLGSDEYDLTNVELRNAVEERLALAKQGVRKPVFWIDTLKDERRTLEKVEAAKTRVFAAGSMDYILLFRQYFLGFNAHVMSNMIENEIAVGINPYSTRWHELGLFLKRKGDKVIAGDFSNFDGSLNARILYRICDMINNWYDDGPENAAIRLVLWEDIASSLHIFDDNVYGWTHSQPSGNPATVIINSLYNSISMRVVWCIVMRDTEYANCISFSRFVNLISFGDDNVLNISDEVISLFNQNSIAVGYASIGMTYTDESKGTDTLPYRSLSDVSFLKRSFRFDNGMKVYQAPLAMDTIMEMCNWTRGDLDVEENVLVNVETALMELSLHPQEIFQLRSQQILRACRKHLDVQPKFCSYLEYRTLNYDKNF